MHKLMWRQVFFALIASSTMLGAFAQASAQTTQAPASAPVIASKYRHGRMPA
ncbi:MAG: hypothetical protein HC782_05455 [Gammaproteobacteria bacterium]|nr:hypothetical protein [Gammaproteobacteria bacterium]